MQCSNGLKEKGIFEYGATESEERSGSGMLQNRPVFYTKGDS